MLDGPSRSRKVTQLSQEQAALLIVAVLAMLPHIFMLFYFMATGVYAMAFINAGSVIIYVAMIFAALNNKINVTSLFITIEIIVYSCISMVLVGQEARTSLFLINLMLAHFMFSPNRRTQRIVLIALVMIVFIAQSVYGYIVPPVYSGRNFTPLGLITSIFMMIAILIELALNQITEQFTMDTISRNLAHLRKEALVDPLTKLWNRGYISQVANNDRKSDGVVIVMLDIDDFKQINDHFGHAVGDVVLTRFAAMMRDKFRSTDGLVRWGGEEFVMILHGTNALNAQRLIKSFLRHVSETPIKCSNFELKITVTAGLCFLEREMTILDAINIADKRMYYGKKHGKNQAVYLEAEETESQGTAE